MICHNKEETEKFYTKHDYVTFWLLTSNLAIVVLIVVEEYGEIGATVKTLFAKIVGGNDFCGC